MILGNPLNGHVQNMSQSQTFASTHPVDSTPVLHGFWVDNRTPSNYAKLYQTRTVSSKNDQTYLESMKIRALQLRDAQDKL